MAGVRSQPRDPKRCEYFETASEYFENGSDAEGVEMDQNDQEIVRRCLAEMRATLMAAKPETQLGANARIIWLSNIIAARTREIILPNVRLG